MSPAETPPIKTLPIKTPVRKSLKYSFIDGIFYSIMFGAGDTFINPYAIAFRATPQEIGLLSSLPGLASSLSQYKAAEITNVLGRKKTMVIFVLLHAIMWLPILLIPWVFKSHWPLWLILFVTLYSIFGSLGGPAWGSIMSQYVPENMRGKYFGFRNKYLGGTTLVAGLAAGIFLWLTDKTGLLGFSVLFGVAFVCRLISWYFLSKMYEPRLPVSSGADFCFRDFITRVSESNFVKFVLFVALMSFAVNLAAPFFSVYMLRELQFNYLSYVIIQTTVTLFVLLTLSTWGKNSDRVGNVSVIRLTGMIIPSLPLLWLFSSSKIYLVFVNALAGFAWAGFNLAVSNFIFDAVSPEKRVRCISYFNLINGIGLCLGALTGGFIVPYLPEISGSPFLTLFAISGLLRFLVWLTVMPQIKEVRKVLPVNSKDLFFSVIGFRPIIGVPQDSLRME